MNEYFRNNYGCRVQKVSVNAVFTCPNRDGSKAFGGCTYCDNSAFNPSYCTVSKPVSTQISEGIEFHKTRYRRADKYLVFFQAFSNTYAPVQTLKSIYTEALSCPGVIGLVIGTRPDCIDDEKINLLSELSVDHLIIVEYGVETTNNTTLEIINRQHIWEDSLNAIKKTSGAGVKTGAHFIFGLPGESRDEMIERASVISDLSLFSVKFHQLQIIRNTRMAEEFNNNPEAFDLFEQQEYIDFIIRFVEHLSPSIIIERFSGEVPPRFLIAPDWGLIRNDQLNVLIEKKMEEIDTWQGKYF